jgi:hypothetical protein
MAKTRRIHTIYDVMDEKGVFESNPANFGAIGPEKNSIYKKAEYPKMLYHPEGAKRVLVPAVAETTPFGPQWMGEQREIINRIVGDEAEEKHWRGLGWHDHPARAMAAAGDEMPEISSDTRVNELQSKIDGLLAELARANELAASATAANAGRPAAVSRK